MNWPFALGRVLLVVFFLVSGVLKLVDLDGTANEIARIGATLTFPAAVTDVAAQIVDILQMPMPKILTIVVGIVEVLGGLLIALNILPRTAAVVLLLYTAVVTFYFHDFWNLQAGAEKTNNMNHALKNLSIIGALLMLAAWPRRGVAEASERHEHL